MNFNNNRSMLLLTLAQNYLNENIERYNESEKKQFMNELLETLKGKNDFVYDKVYDFLLFYDLIDGVSRHKTFARYLNKRYSPATHKTILDVGTGRLCKLSCNLTKRGYNMYAMDPNIRILEHEAKDINIHISKNLFLCDEFSKDNKGTDIKKFDLIVGLEPCLATEHIIRQGLKYEKPFEVVLCYEAHNALNGKHFKTPEDWFEHLLKISQEIEIIKQDKDFIARHQNSEHIHELEREF